jgi:hypothetical protein
LTAANTTCSPLPLDRKPSVLRAARLGCPRVDFGLDATRQPQFLRLPCVVKANYAAEQGISLWQVC